MTALATHPPSSASAAAESALQARAPRSLASLIFKLMDGLSGATLGLLFYGGWGVWANSAHGWSVALRSGAAQGAMSFVVTLSGVTLMKWLFSFRGPLWLRGAVSIIGSLLLIYGGIVGIHLWLGTPEILLTLAPGLPITIVFCCVFVCSMLRIETAARQHDSAKDCQ